MIQNYDLTKKEIELLNAFAKLHVCDKQKILEYVRKFADKKKRCFRKYDYTDYRTYKGYYKGPEKESNEKVISNWDSMIMNGIPGREYTNFYEGFCYIGVDSNWKGFYKIGHTADSTCKSRTSTTINPNYHILYRTRRPYQNARKVEAEIFDNLSLFQVTKGYSTEWFELSDDILEKIIKKYDFVKLEDLIIQK